MSRVSVAESICNASLFRTKVPIYNDWIETDLRECFVVILVQMQNVFKELVKKRDLGMKNYV